MVERDYIKKMISQLVDVLLVDIFKEKDIEKIENQNEEYNNLKHLVDAYDINQAENYLFENVNSLEDFEVALLFYRYVNEKDNDFLEKSNYSRDEIKQGIEDISKKFGYDNIVNIFLS